ncbi:LolA family protein [Streptomyces mexicanus]|uniref:Outer membrane lipoprotein carrier protein LolA n=1 Tax=Streptomyces mexicanus TaxID=178566 RepID=A0A7X1HVX6_9ACTN|nr:outer membrane lipoprotein carrier protein LolA [Streptomyces mexicanus]MBC2864001.1 outer membrane lipoprotein carrier protein LolA [Streptomyces mexicanus]
MAPYESDDTRDAEKAGDPHARRRKAARYVVPVAVVGVAAATIGLVPALADSGDPDLPKITAQQLIEKIAKSDVEQLSGTVRISTDLGLPDLGGLADGLVSGGGKGGDGSSADPSAKLTELASGTHTLRVATDGPDRQKISLIESAAEYSIVHNGKDLWGYDSKSDEVYHSTVPQQGKEHRDQAPATPKDFADEALKSVDDTTSVTVDGTARVAGRDAYRLVVKPRHASGTTVGVISVAVDAKTGMPLKFTLTPASGGAAVVDAGFTRVSFAEPAASTFRFTPPKGAKVTEGEHAAAGEHSLPSGGFPKGLLPSPGLAGGGTAKDGMKVLGTGWNSIATFDTGARGGIPSSSGQGALSGFLGSLGDQVSGTFGKGTVFSTRLINALITDDGKVYAGAVTKDALVKAANAAQ